MLLTSRNQRSVKACDRCRVKKVRCCGLLPCTRCRQDDAICEYDIRRKSDGKSVSQAHVDQLHVHNEMLAKALRKVWETYATPVIGNGHEKTPSIHEMVRHCNIIATPKSHLHGDLDALERFPAYADSLDTRADLTNKDTFAAAHILPQSDGGSPSIYNDDYQNSQTCTSPDGLQAQSFSRVGAVPPDRMWESPPPIDTENVILESLHEDKVVDYTAQAMYVSPEHVYPMAQKSGRAYSHKPTGLWSNDNSNVVVTPRQIEKRPLECQSGYQFNPMTLDMPINWPRGQGAAYY